MNVIFSDTYHVIRLIHSDGRVDTKTLTNSNDINHELLTVMHANNYSDKVLIQDQEIYLELPSEVRDKVTYKDLLSTLSSIGMSQFDLNEDDTEHGLFEYRSKLDASEVTSIDLDEDIKEVHFFKYNGETRRFELIKKLELKLGSRKLIILTSSPSKSISTINQQIHNNMQDPHMNSKDIYLSQSDLTEYQNIDTIITDDYTNIQCNIKLADADAKSTILGNLGDSEYIHIIHDTVSNRFVFCINFKPIKCYDIQI